MDLNFFFGNEIRDGVAGFIQAINLIDYKLLLLFLLVIYLPAYKMLEHSGFFGRQRKGKPIKINCPSCRKKTWWFFQLDMDEKAIIDFDKMKIRDDLDKKTMVKGRYSCMSCGNQTVEPYQTDTHQAGARELRQYLTLKRYAKLLGYRIKGKKEAPKVNVIYTASIPNQAIRIQ
jgi:hypothetical protein